jgi:hypothetical protein
MWVRFWVIALRFSGRDQMEELAAAEEAKKIIDTLSTTSPSDPTIAATLRNAYDQARRGATPILSSAMVLNAARYEAVLELNDLIHSLQLQSLTQQKINRAKAAVDAWIKLLKGHGWREIIFAEAVKEAAKEFKVAEALQDRIVATQDDLAPRAFLPTFERRQRSTNARDDVIPSAFFLRWILEIKTVNSAARKVAAAVVDRAFFNSWDREESSGHAHIVQFYTPRSVITSKIGPRRFMAQIALWIDRQRGTTITCRVLLPNPFGWGSFVNSEYFAGKFQACPQVRLNKRRPLLRPCRADQASQHDSC